MAVKKKWWYLSGPITGYANHNEEEFATQAAFLRSKGYSILNPCAWPHLKTWAANLKRDIKRLMTCEGVFVLKGWQASRGAVLEIFVAIILGMPIRDAYTMKPVKVSTIKLFKAAFRSLVDPSQSFANV
ncbi:unnamed protein product [marine sediment metagenome]|uniref:DUF4406 domain-containing protein n=1 Tax=marine sediment metagenome TaxID=412755 RepID=X0XC48_9ZZZZ